MDSNPDLFDLEAPFRQTGVFGANIFKQLLQAVQIEFGAQLEGGPCTLRRFSRYAAGIQSCGLGGGQTLDLATWARGAFRRETFPAGFLDYQHHQD